VKHQPILKTKRLILRPFTLDDALAVQRLAGDKEIADTTINIPHPYPDGAAEEWIGMHTEQFQRGRVVTYAVVLKDSGQLIGAISLTVTSRFDYGEMGYWICRESWNRGYCTEAAQAILEYGFGTLGLNKIFAEHFTRNEASRAVMEKIGMSFEGTLRHHAKRWGRYEDLDVRSILREEYEPFDW
jgi:ribosomal-protein-alanine N-acetyltransferase